MTTNLKTYEIKQAIEEIRARGSQAVASEIKSMLRKPVEGEDEDGVYVSIAFVEGLTKAEMRRAASLVVAMQVLGKMPQLQSRAVH